MRVNVSYTIEVPDYIRREINAWYGRPGLASRAEVKRWYEANGLSMDDDLEDLADSREEQEQDDDAES
jgi:hypothetical protein